MNKNISVTANSVNTKQIHTLKDIPISGYFMFRHRYRGCRTILYQRIYVLNVEMVYCLTDGDYQLITDGLLTQEVIPIEKINISYDYEE